MSRLIKIAAVSALALAAGGCATQPALNLTPHNNTGVYSLHQPVVERTNFVFDVATEGDRVAPAEQARLAAWFESIELAYGDHVTVDEPDGFGSEGARRDVARVAAQYGLIVNGDASPVTEGNVAPGYVRIVASRSTASVEGCPSWTNPGIESPTRTSTNYGCATNSNLAAMVANPDDLVHGREGSGEGNTVVAGRAIRTYRESQPTSRQGLPAGTTTGR